MRSSNNLDAGIGGNWQIYFWRPSRMEPLRTHTLYIYSK